jgi:hypothetical protein
MAHLLRLSILKDIESIDQYFKANIPRAFMRVTIKESKGRINRLCIHETMNRTGHNNPQNIVPICGGEWSNDEKKKKKKS